MLSRVSYLIQSCCCCWQSCCYCCCCFQREGKDSSLLQFFELRLVQKQFSFSSISEFPHFMFNVHICFTGQVKTISVYRVCFTPFFSKYVNSMIFWEFILHYFIIYSRFSLFRVLILFSKIVIMLQNRPWYDLLTGMFFANSIFLLKQIFQGMLMVVQSYQGSSEYASV